MVKTSKSKRNKKGGGSSSESDDEASTSLSAGDAGIGVDNSKSEALQISISEAMEMVSEKRYTKREGGLSLLIKHMQSSQETTEDIGMIQDHQENLYSILTRLLRHPSSSKEGVLCTELLNLLSVQTGPDEDDFFTLFEKPLTNLVSNSSYDELRGCSLFALSFMSFICCHDSNSRIWHFVEFILCGRLLKKKKSKKQLKESTANGTNSKVRGKSRKKASNTGFSLTSSEEEEENDNEDSAWSDSGDGVADIDFDEEDAEESWSGGEGEKLDASYTPLPPASIPVLPPLPPPSVMAAVPSPRSFSSVALSRPSLSLRARAAECWMLMATLMPDEIVLQRSRAGVFAMLAELLFNGQPQPIAPTPASSTDTPASASSSFATSSGGSMKGSKGSGKISTSAKRSGKGSFTEAPASTIKSSGGADNNSSIIDARISAGKCYAYLWEVAVRHTGVDPTVTSPSIMESGQYFSEVGHVLCDDEDLLERVIQQIRAVSKDSSKRISKRDRKEQRSEFRDIEDFIVKGLAPDSDCEVVRMQGAVLEVDSFRMRILMETLTAVLGGGMHSALRLYPVVRDILSVEHLTNDMDGDGREVRVGKGSSTSKRRTQYRKQDRQMRQDAVSSCDLYAMAEGDDY